MIEGVVFAGVYLLGLGMGRFSKKDNGLKHEHIWKPVSSQHLNLYAGDNARRPTQRTTKVLKVCYCGDNKVQTIEGNWDFDQLTSHQL